MAGAAPAGTPSPVQLSVVIPAYNEESRIGLTLDRVLEYVERAGLRAEVIVVDDGSLDETADVVRNRQGTAIPVLLMQYAPNHGKGRAIKTGSLATRGELVLHMDADYSVPLEELTKLMDAVVAGADIAIGSRALAESQLARRQAWLREGAGKAFGWIQKWLLGLPWRDTQCGFKLFTHRAVDLLFPRQELDSVVYDGEVLYLARQAGLRVVEVPVIWQHDPDSRIRYGVSASLAVFRDLWRVRRLHGDSSGGGLRR